MKMKRYFLLLTLLSFAFVFEAKEVSYDEALQTASEFFAPASSSKKQVKALKSNLSLATTFNQTEAEKPAFYVINNGEKGFVIVSADDNAKQILAYSEEGAFDANNIPSNVKFWLNRYAEEISYMVKNGSSKPLYASPTYTAIEPLLGDILHNQNSPYNDLCPLIGGTTRAATGCVATAAGQIMTKWKYPTTGTGTVSYSWNGTTLSADFSKSTYDWKNILDRYVYNYWEGSQNYNDAQGTAIAQLLKDIGYAAQMVYGKESSSNDQAMAAGLVNNFKYDKSLTRVAFNASYSANGKSETMNWNLEEDMMDEIYAELQAGRPMFIAGTAPVGNTGHAFVCDGIQSDGKLHINWGWDGSGNGYYELTGFKPTGDGIGSGTRDYTANVAFLTHIQPNKGTKTTPVEVGLRNLSYTQTTNQFTKSNQTSINLFKATTTSGTNVVYAGYDYFNLGYTDITRISLGYALYKKNVRVYSSAAPWMIWNNTANVEEMDIEDGSGNTHKGIDLPVYAFSGIQNDITPTGSISTLVNNVQTGVYDLHVAAKDHAVGVFYPVYIWNRGKVKNKIAVGKNKVYIYPANTNYSRNNKPTNLQSTQNGSTYTLSWSGNAANYMLLIWNDDDLTVEKVSSKSKTGVAGGQHWAVFACETSGSLVYATSDIAYSVTDGSVPDDDPEEEPTPVDEVSEDGITVATNQLTIEVKAAAVNAIQIYNVLGDRLYSVQGTQASFKAPQAGVYVVQVGDKKRKVLVK